MNRLPIDAYGALGEINQDHVKLISVIFIIGKVLVVKILMSPTKIGLGTHLPD